MKKFLLYVTIFFSFTGMSFAQEGFKGEDWKDWVGRKVNVNYDCCGLGTCKLLIGAKLTEVTDKSVTVVTNGAPFLIPRYVIQSMQLSNDRQGNE